jgi:hypothetical protein
MPNHQELMAFHVEALFTHNGDSRRLVVNALYSTSWANTASQAVSKKLHLMRYGVDFHVT